jgi:LCP family protein required for cell wall assembly
MLRRRQDRAFPAVNWSWAVVIVAIVGVVGAISLIMLATTGRTNPPPTAASLATSAPIVGKTSIAALPANIRPWDGKQRFTVLVMGVDKRPGETGTGYRTDTMILVSVDPTTKAIGMLSIPRDVYVAIPGQADLQAINRAYVLGELDRIGGGPKLAMQTIQYNFGIPVNSYVVVTFEAAIGMVDAIGGIDIDVPQAIDDPEYPDMNFGYEPLFIPKGPTHMDGQLALKYARTRHQGTDFDRAYRQQQIIMAIRQRITKPEVLSQLLAQAPSLWEKLSKGVLTDITFDQALSMGWYVKDIPLISIRRGTVEDKYLQATQHNGETILVPNRARIGELMAQVFGENYSR